MNMFARAATFALITTLSSISSADNLDKPKSASQNTIVTTKADQSFGSINSIYSSAYGEYKKGNYKEARQLAEYYVTNHPQDFRAFQLLASISIKENDSNAALKYIQHGISVSHKKTQQQYISSARLLMGAQPIPLAQIEYLLQTASDRFGTTDQIIEALFNSNLVAGKYLRAMHWLNQLPEESWDDPRWDMYKARLFEKQGNMDAAIDVYKGVISFINYQPIKIRRLPNMVKARKESRLAIARLSPSS